MIQEIGRQTDRVIRDSVQGLWSQPHLESIRDSFLGSFEQLVGKNDRLLAGYEAGSQVFLRVINFKSLRQVAS